VLLNQTMTSVGTLIYVAGTRPLPTPTAHLPCHDDPRRQGHHGVLLPGAQEEEEAKDQGWRGDYDLEHAHVHQGFWRPLLPLTFKKAYTKLDALIERCWNQVPEERPSFDEIVRLMQGDIAEEILAEGRAGNHLSEQGRRFAYRATLGIDEQFEDDGEDGMDTTKMVSQRVHTETRRTPSSRRRTRSSRRRTRSSRRRTPSLRRRTPSSRSCRRGSRKRPLSNIIERLVLDETFTYFLFLSARRSAAAALLAPPVLHVVQHHQFLLLASARPAQAAHAAAEFALLALHHLLGQIIEALAQAHVLLR